MSLLILKLDTKLNTRTTSYWQATKNKYLQKQSPGLLHHFTTSHLHFFFNIMYEIIPSVLSLIVQIICSYEAIYALFIYKTNFYKWGQDHPCSSFWAQSNFHEKFTLIALEVGLGPKWTWKSLNMWTSNPHSNRWRKVLSNCTSWGGSEDRFLEQISYLYV